MKYVVCNPEDLLECPDGTKMAQGGTRVFERPGDALKFMETMGQFWEEDVFPCDASDEDLCTNKEGYTVLWGGRPVSESKRLHAVVTFCQIDKKQLSRLAMMAYVMAAAKIPFFVCYANEGVIKIQCMRQHVKQVESIMNLSLALDIEVPIAMSIAATPADAKSKFDIV